MLVGQFRAFPAVLFLFIIFGNLSHTTSDFQLTHIEMMVVLFYGQDKGIFILRSKAIDVEHLMIKTTLTLNHCCL